MTPRQAQLVRESFESLRTMSGPLSQLFYGRLFSLDPSLRALFRNDMRQQGEKLMAMLAAIVDSADDFGAVRQDLRELGRRHAAYGAQVRHYEAVTSALLWTLGQALERGFDAEMKQAWSELLDAVNDEMRKGVPTH